jgi:hypothetical protein
MWPEQFGGMAIRAEVWPTGTRKISIREFFVGAFTDAQGAVWVAL